jgi:hypothetical protein
MCFFFNLKLFIYFGLSFRFGLDKSVFILNSKLDFFYF